MHSQQSTNYEYDDNSAASSDESEYSVTNSEMLHVVLRRLRKIEQDNEIVKISLKTKDMQIKQLEMEVERLRRRRRDDDGNSDTESIASDAQPLITINNHNNSTTSNIESPASNAEISAVFPFDMVQITNAIAGLNVEAGDGQKRVIMDQSGAHKFVEKQKLPLKVFKNGIFFMKGPFRSFTEDSTSLSFLKDIADGYFPWELNKLYPDGVQFDLEDCSTQDYQRNSPQTQTTKPIAINKMAHLNPLSQLPKFVIKEGNVISLKKEIEEFVSPSSKQSLQILVIPNKTLTKDIAIIRVKDVSDTAVVYEITVDCKETIGNLIELLGQDHQKCSLLKSEGHSKMLDFHHTVKECGLAPRSLLYLRSKK